MSGTKVKKIITSHPTTTEAWVSSLIAVQKYKCEIRQFGTVNLQCSTFHLFFLLRMAISFLDMKYGFSSEPSLRSESSTTEAVN